MLVRWVSWRHDPYHILLSDAQSFIRSAGLRARNFDQVAALDAVDCRVHLRSIPIPAGGMQKSGVTAEHDFDLAAGRHAVADDAIQVRARHRCARGFRET